MPRNKDLLLTSLATINKSLVQLEAQTRGHIKPSHARRLGKVVESFDVLRADIRADLERKDVA